MIKRMIAALAVATLGMVGLTTTPAQAAYSDCSAYGGTICMHQHSNFTGQVWRQYPSQISGCRNLSPDDFNDEASTVFNNTTTHILYLYQHSGCTGEELSIPKGGVRSFASTNTWWNDRASSVYVLYVG
jgi:hypothetical protein